MTKQVKKYIFLYFLKIKHLYGFHNKFLNYNRFKI